MPRGKLLGILILSLHLFRKMKLQQFGHFLSSFSYLKQIMPHHF